MEDVIGVMKTSVSRLKAPSSDTSEEVKAFGNYIISKMKSYSEETRKGVEHTIYDILVKAGGGYYENSIPSTSTTPPSSHALQVCPPIPSPMASQYSTNSIPFPHSTESLRQQPQESLITHSQPRPASRSSNTF
ncbi:hypothetical protein ABEB36_012685 [Hypothenemus hampei]|uniref:Uncharacterized protein n=1 Tax=Hypothenemus hampei TaxID=57062 RepID=A0ABD1EC23_HYPHA